MNDPSSDPRVREFVELLAVVDQLRDPGGCPWDRDQDLDSIAPTVVEEAFEVADALARGERGEVASELGDVLMNVLLASRIAEDAGDFTLADVARSIREKLVHRHPHVFGDASVRDAGHAVANWEEIKRREREQSADPSTLAGVPAALPALLRASRIGEKAAKVGFEWPDMSGPFAKLYEEIEELQEAISENVRDEVESELGDVLFSVVNVARHAGVDPEVALRRTVGRFSERFRFVEREVGKPLREATLGEMEEQWQRSKTALLEGPYAVPWSAPDEWRDAVRALRQSRESVIRWVRDLPEDRVEAAPAGVSTEPPPPPARSIIERLRDLLACEREVVRDLTAFLDRADLAGAPDPFPADGLANRPPRTPLVPPFSAPAREGTDRGDRRATLEALELGRKELLDLLPRLVHRDPRPLLLPNRPGVGQLDALQVFAYLAHVERALGQEIHRVRTSPGS